MAFLEPLGTNALKSGAMGGRSMPIALRLH